MICIHELAADKAALVIAGLCSEKGGEWLVNAVEDEGFVAARIGSPGGGRLARSGSPHLAGPFNARWSLHVIAADLADARSAGERSDASRRKEVSRFRADLLTKIVRLLGTGEKRVADLANATGVCAWTVRSALAMLKRGGEITKRRRGNESFYSLARREGKVA